jgi:hypothetical protein
MGAIGAPPEKNHNATLFDVFSRNTIITVNCTCQNYHTSRNYRMHIIFTILNGTSARRSGRASLKRQGKFQVSGNTDDAAKRLARACH